MTHCSVVGQEIASLGVNQRHQTAVTEAPESQKCGGRPRGPESGLHLTLPGWTSEVARHGASTLGIQSNRRFLDPTD